ncbi:MAG TPA: hypothetical protein VMW52_05730 [Phycisphaerae bacterium]|nr:hypothetical protein [Phycisphaerae bacterium]
MGCCGDDHPAPRNTREMIAQLFEMAGPEAAAKHRLAICLHCGPTGGPCLNLAKAAGEVEPVCGHRSRQIPLGPGLVISAASCPEDRW